MGESEGQILETPGLSLVFFALAFLSFVGGATLANAFWPGNAGFGYAWKPEAYILSITWFLVGLTEAALFAAIGQGLRYLHQIVANTARK